LKRSLGTKVSIESGRKGGKIMIEYYSPEDLERLMEIMLGWNEQG
jgi:ParB family chromosome partitioning protein